MTAPRASDSGDAPGDGTGLQDKRVGPLELFFDLVFVLALTQVTARVSADPTAGGVVRGLLVLAAVWWAWAAYAWLTNEVDGNRAAVRLTIFAAMAAMLVASLAVGGAFEGDAVLFAAAYLCVRVLHVLLFIAGTEHVDVRQAARALAPTAVLAPAVLLASTALDDALQIGLWVVALLIDYVGGALRGIDGWRLSPGHFAERHGLVVIIALGESIVAIGVGAHGIRLGAGALTAAALGVALTAMLWWTYFDEAVDAIEGRLVAASGRARNTAARDAFSFLHLPLVTSIVLLAVGLKNTLAHTGDPLGAVGALGLCAGAGGFLLGTVAVRWRCLGALDRSRVFAATVCFAMFPAAPQLPALVMLCAIVVVCGALVVVTEIGAAGRKGARHPA